MDYVIIVAGGKGLRMGSDIPKQFLPIGGKPVLMRTLERFREYDADLQIILVLPEAQQSYWHQLCEEYHFDVAYTLANGGQTRFHSVQNGLAETLRHLSSSGQTRTDTDHEKSDNVKSETVREVRCLKESRTVPRDEYRLVQTPQTFDIQLLKAANRQPYNDGFTDDASVVESYGHQIALVEGNRENIKITTPYDLRIGEVLATDKHGLTRTI